MGPSDGNHECHKCNPKAYDLESLRRERASAALASADDANVANVVTACSTAEASANVVSDHAAMASATTTPQDSARHLYVRYEKLVFTLRFFSMGSFWPCCHRHSSIVLEQENAKLKP